MNMLIIGGTRFVGYLLAWRLLAGGHGVTLFNRGTHPDPFGDRVARLTGDRTTSDFEALLEGRRFDAVVDFAAYTAEDARRAVEALDGNIDQYVFISTGQVYLVREGCPQPAGEEDYEGEVLPEPDDPADREGWLYGVGKREAEDVLAAAWSRYAFPATRLRIPMVNGERDYYRRVESYLWRILDGGPILLTQGGTQLCRHVYGAEVAKAIAGLLDNGDTIGQVYNLCQEEQPTVAEVVLMLADILGAPARIAPVSAEHLEEAGLRPVDVSPFSGRWMSRLDPGKAQRELEFRHQPVRAYLEKIVAAFLAHPPASPPENYKHRSVEFALTGFSP